MFLNSDFANWWGHKLYDLISSNDWQRKKKGIKEMQIFEYFKNKNKLFDWNKKHSGPPLEIKCIR